MPDGILDLIGFAATVVFALPVALAGIAFVGRGNLGLGVGLIGVAIAMLVVEEYLATPGDIPEMVASGVTSKLLGGSDKEE